MDFLLITYTIVLLVSFTVYLQANLALTSGQSYSIASGKLPFPPLALVEAVKFLRACLANSAGVTKEQVLTNQTLPTISTFLTQVVETGESNHKIHESKGILDGSTNVCGSDN